MISENKIELQQLSDEQLMRRFQQDDIECFNILVDRYKNQLLNFIFRFIGDMAVAEDLVQETFLRLYRKKHYYKEIAKFSTWIYTIASNLAKSELRRRKRRNFFSIHNVGEENKDFDIPDPDADPYENAQTSMVIERIQTAIADLPLHFKEVVLMRDVQGLSYEEISDALGIPLGTVKSRVNRGRLKLQEELGYLFDKNDGSSEVVR
jgi:RNA polymerase sigma-70 factor (ECF subfamily)